MNLDDHNSNEQKERKLHYYDQEWPQPVLSPRFTPQQFYLPPQHLPNFNLHDQEQGKPFRKTSNHDHEQPDEEQFKQFYPPPPYIKYPPGYKYPPMYPPPWYRPQYPPFYYPPYDASQYQNTLSKELQTKVNQLVSYQKVSPFQCNCKKSKCLKLYCECFANNWVCSQNCNCTECKNRIDNPNERSKAIEEALLRNPEAFSALLNNNGQQPQIIQEQISQKETPKETKRGCNCKKSECKKKYCECFSINQRCTDLCKCENCLNKESGEAPQEKEQINEEPEQKKEKIQKSEKSKKIKKQTPEANDQKKKKKN